MLDSCHPYVFTSICWVRSKSKRMLQSLNGSRPVTVHHPDASRSRISLTTGKTCLPIECRENPAGLQCLAGPQHRCNLRIHSALFLRALGTAELRNCWDSIRVSVSPVKYQELLCSSIQRICFANRIVEWIKLATKPSDQTLENGSILYWGPGSPRYFSTTAHL